MIAMIEIPRVQQTVVLIRRAPGQIAVGLDLRPEDPVLSGKFQRVRVEHADTGVLALLVLYGDVYLIFKKGNESGTYNMYIISEK